MASDRVVIASRYWPTALSLIRSLGAAGFVVDLAASVPKARFKVPGIEQVCQEICGNGLQEHKN